VTVTPSSPVTVIADEVGDAAVVDVAADVGVAFAVADAVGGGTLRLVEGVLVGAALAVGTGLAVGVGAVVG